MSDKKYDPLEEQRRLQQRAVRSAWSWKPRNQQGLHKDARHDTVEWNRMAKFRKNKPIRIVPKIK